MPSTEKWEERFDKEFGAVFSFPAYIDNATGFCKGNTRVAQAYAGKYDSHEIKSFISKLLLEAREQGKQELLSGSGNWPNEVRLQARTQLINDIVERLEKTKLIEAEFPGSKYTLEWKRAKNKGIEDSINIIKGMVK